MDDDTQEFVDSIKTPPTKTFHGLEAAGLLSAKESLRFEQSETGPFLKTMRLACPIRSFASRKTAFCIGCEYYRGVGVKTATGALDPEDPSKAERSYTIICAHPLSRTPRHCPED